MMRWSSGPHGKMDPAFGQALRQVLLAGVEAQTHTTQYQDGVVKLKRRLALRSENE